MIDYVLAWLEPSGITGASTGDNFEVLNTLTPSRRPSRVPDSAPKIDCRPRWLRRLRFLPIPSDRLANLWRYPGVLLRHRVHPSNFRTQNRSRLCRATMRLHTSPFTTAFDRVEQIQDGVDV